MSDHRQTSSPQPTIAHDSPVARAAAEFCRRTPAPGGPAPGADGARELASAPSWRAVRDAGSEVWLDSGDAEANAQVWTAEFSGLTTNNALLNAEVQKGTHDDLVPAAARTLREADESLSTDDVVRECAFVVNAVHALGLVRAFAADVSVELHTDLVHDVDASYECGRRLHAICPEHFVVKIALTPAGLIAARRLERDGVRVNCTLGFSPRQNLLLARFVQPHFVNVFLGRVNALCERLGHERVGGADDGAPAATLADLRPGEAATIASQRLLRQLRAERRGAGPTRQIAASMREGAQVATLAGVDVLTMPVAAAREFAESATPAADITDRTRDPGAAPPAGPVGEPTPLDVFLRPGEAVAVAAERLVARDLDTLDAGRVEAILADCGAGDLFPTLTDDERARVADDGKIPDPKRWRDRVAAQSASWDGLLTEAALGHFGAAQRELDDRIRGLL